MRPRVFLALWTSLIALGMLTILGAAAWNARACKGSWPATDIQEGERSLAQGRFYYWRVRRDGAYAVRAHVAPQAPQTLQTFAKRLQPEIAINGGYFDPANGQTTSFVSEDGAHWHDPRQNPRLTQNPALTPYLPAIFNRSEFRLYACADGRRYAIERRDAPAPIGCSLRSALGAGPQLAPDNGAQSEAFIAQDASGRRTRDPLGVDRPNARSLIGIDAHGDALLGLFTQEPHREGARGVTLSEASALMMELGATRVMALDGGSSSGAYSRGVYHYGKFNAKGAPEKRALKSILAVSADPAP